MNYIELVAYKSLKPFGRRKFVHDGVEYICMKRHNTLLSAQKFLNGQYRFQLHSVYCSETSAYTYSHINRPIDRASQEMLEELGWRLICLPV